jgi:hypothetical protein
MLEPIPFAGMVEIDESFDRTASHMAGEYVSYRELTDEEIQELALSDEFWISEDCTIFDWHKFARAVIKLAQEK